MALDEILHSRIDETTKGFPGGRGALALAEIGSQGWSLLAEDVPLPACVLKASALGRNESFMREFLGRSGASISPHGKTTMSPQLFARQMAAGAWAITVGNIHQIQVARHFGFARIVLANQLVGRQAIRYVLDEIARDPAFEFYSLVDSVALVETLARAARERGIQGRFNVFLEGGVAGARTGVRDIATARAVARAVKAASPYLTLCGVEGFEGVISGDGAAAKIGVFLDFLVDIARMIDAEDLAGPGPLILTAGGSAFYDVVVAKFAGLNLRRKSTILTRSGCYLTHDSRMYENAYRAIAERSSAVAGIAKPAHALEVWAYVQSRPEPTRALVTMGKRDVSHDRDLPIPLLWHRPGSRDKAPAPLGADHACVALNDQHGFLDIPASSPLAVGDMVGFGISHPCLTFDKWQLIYLVDDSYRIVDAIRTYF
jgi:D-serine dehydratase